MSKNLYIVNGSNGKHWHAGIIADAIVRKYRGIRESAEYSALEDRFYDYTQACDTEEQRGWMGHYMNEALKMDYNACRLMARGKDHWSAAQGMRYEAAIQFIVAYDMML